MYGEDKKWIANRIKLLDEFAQQVSDKIWKKMPYKTWKEIAHVNDANITIVRYKNAHCEYRYSVILNKLSLAENYVDFDANDNSFGSFLDNVFLSPAYTSKLNSEANKKMMDSDRITGVPSNLNVQYSDNTNLNYGYGTSTAGNSITVDSNGYWTTTASSIIYKTPCGEDDVRRLIKEYFENEKEKNKMDTSKMFNFDFGPVSGSNFRMSPFGLAVRTQNNGWIAYNQKTGELVDVEVLNFDISKMIYKMPVALSAIKPGDVLMHAGKPVFVRDIGTGTLAGPTVSVINYADATVVDILPVKSPFGFNFFTKVTPLFDVSNLGANNDNPFGNMLPFLMLNGEGSGDFDPTLLFLASSMSGGSVDFASNPMMLYFLMNRKDKGDILPFLMMMNGGIFGTPTAPVVTLK